jgi:hypothetical protein
MRALLAILFVLSCHYSFAQLGAIKGDVLEDSTNEIIPSGQIRIYKNDSDTSYYISFSSGRFSMENFKPDTVNISCEAECYQKAVKKGVIIAAFKVSFLNFYLKKK